MTINVDCPPVEDEEEALKLMIYHLKMAAMYFEATPSKFPDHLYEGEFSATPMITWVLEMEKLYPDDEF